jgi:hypothetical protein
MKVLTLEADSPLDAQQYHKQSEAQTSTGWQCHGCVAWFFTLLGALLHPDTSPLSPVGIHTFTYNNTACYLTVVAFIHQTSVSLYHTQFNHQKPIFITLVLLTRIIKNTELKIKGKCVMI